MRFEYDQHKSNSNLEKHGIDFDEAKELWYDQYGFEIFMQSKGENRYMRIARYGGVYWSAIFTKRESSIRIISVRKSTRKEVSVYDRERNNQ